MKNADSEVCGLVRITGTLFLERNVAAMFLKCHFKVPSFLPLSSTVLRRRQGDKTKVKLDVSEQICLFVI